MEKDLFNKESFNEGFLLASQVVASAIIRSIHQHPLWMSPSVRRQVIAQIQLSTQFILEKRKLIPTRYQVMRGLAKDIPLNFDYYDDFD